MCNIELESQNNSRKRNLKEQEEITHTSKDHQELAKDLLLEKKYGILDYGLEDFIKEKIQANSKHIKQTSHKKAKQHEDIYNSD